MKKYLFFLLIFSVVFSGCKSVWMGAVGGAATGIVVGAGTGKLLGNTAIGAVGGVIIGGSIGAIASASAKKEKNAEKAGKNSKKKITFEKALLTDSTQLDSLRVNNLY